VSAKPSVRCAVYTRKSSEEGLDQAFNSLDAQYEACAAYVASQRHEGWRLLETRYDDGGISGATLERDGVQRLLRDIERGLINMVVVYKIDRLTRSLADFARLVERFDQAGCSFVSVTQAFNTSTSMGRLTLNVLLSFAQFEREVTGERIRDKIAASKKKGMWMGGMVPLGYDVNPDTRDACRLMINPAEAEQVRFIYTTYARTADLIRTAELAKAEGIRSKRRAYQSGGRFGGNPLSQGQVHFLLHNPIYRGCVRHKNIVYPGLHEAIIDEALWNTVQATLQRHGRSTRRVRDKATGALKASQRSSPLTGKLFDETGDRLTPSHSTKAGKDGGSIRRRYYVSGRLLARTSEPHDPTGWRLPAAKLERAVADAIADHLTETSAEGLVATRDPMALYRAQAGVKRLHGRLGNDRDAQLKALVERIEVGPGELRIRLSESGIVSALKQNGGGGIELHADALAFTRPFTLRRRGVETKIITGRTEREPDQTLIRALALAHQWLDEVRSGTSMAAIGRRYGWTNGMVRRRIRFALLSPTITHAILEGRQPAHLTIETIRNCDLPLGWAAQEQLLGFTSEPAPKP